MSGLDMFLVCLAAMFGVIVTHIAMFVGGKWKPNGLSPLPPKKPSQPKEDPAGLGLEDTDPMTPPPPVRPHPTVARVEAKREEVTRAILPDAPSNDDLARILNERAGARDAKVKKLRAALDRKRGE